MVAGDGETPDYEPCAPIDWFPAQRFAQRYGRVIDLFSLSLQRRAALAALWRALAVPLNENHRTGGDVGFRLRRAYGATGWAASGFPLPVKGV